MIHIFVHSASRFMIVIITIRHLVQPFYSLARQLFTKFDFPQSVSVLLCKLPSSHYNLKTVSAWVTKPYRSRPTLHGLNRFFIKNKNQVTSGYRVLKCDVISLQTFPFEPFEPHHAICTAAVRTCAKFQIVILNESEDREVWSFTQSHTNLSYLTSVLTSGTSTK